jgi:two-component system nitrogen regulation response regulator GlnG
MTHRVGERWVMEALAVGKPAYLSRMAPDFIPPGGGLGAPLADPFLSRKPTLLVPGPEGRVRLEPGEGSAVMVAGEPLRGAREFGPEDLATGIPLELAERVVVLLHRWEQPRPLCQMRHAAG